MDIRIKDRPLGGDAITVQIWVLWLLLLWKIFMIIKETISITGKT